MKFRKSLILLIALTTSAAKAQFRDATIPQVPVNLTPVFAANTGNDRLDYSSNTYEVSVWDDSGNNAGLAWKVGSSVGFTLISPGTGVKDPDVVLVENDAGMVFALTCYYAQNLSEFRFELFQWMFGAQAFNSIGVYTLSPGTFEKTINIDASDEGDFVIVWDEPGMVIKCVTGFTPTGGIPDLTGGGAWIQLENGHSPDVSIFRSNIANQADIAYINAQARIAVDLYRLDDLKNGIINLANGFRSPLADLTYRYPRIATPNSLYGDPVDFTVVAEDNDNASSWLIKGFNSNACCNPQFTYAIYNDGTTGNSPYNLTDLPNLRPVASYDKNYNNIWIGWTFDNTSGMLMAPGAAWVKSPVVVIGDKHAALLPAQNYRYVPNGLLFGEQYSALSISGKNSTAMYFTYQKTGANTIFTKSVNQNPVPVGLRNPANTPVITWLQEQASNSENSSKNFHCVLFTTEGKIAYTLFGSIDSILDEMMMISEQTATTFYIAEISNEKGNVLNSGKLILGIR